MNVDAERNLDDVQESVPVEFGLTRKRISDEYYELSNEKCLLKFYFDRHDASKVVVLVCDRTKPSDDGMKFLILRHLFHAKEQPTSEENRFGFIGRTLGNYFRPVLEGDFSVRSKYDRVENDFFDRIDDVMSLPSDAPARRLFDECDIGWLAAVRGK